MNKARRGNHS